MKRDELLKVAKPILFSTPMVQAILAGRKTMTRRVVKGLPGNQSGCDLGIIPHADGKLTGYGFEKIPHQPGDILYVRETWQLLPSGFDEIPPEMRYIYKASDELSEECTKWRPSIFMPKQAARIFLRVTDVRAERLQEITVEDVMREGMDVDNEIRNHDQTTHESIKNWNLAYAQHVFHELWDSINAKRGYGWDTNPWVWVYSFERVVCE